MIVIAEFQAWLRGYVEASRTDGVCHESVDPDVVIDRILEEAAKLDRTAPAAPSNPLFTGHRRDDLIGPAQVDDILKKMVEDGS